MKKEIVMEKERDIAGQLNRMAQNGLSPSALNTYVRCPLQFYYRYVARVKVPEQPEVSVQANTFGSVVHGVLETLYKPFLGKLINHSVLLTGMEKNLDNLLQQKFTEIYGNHDLKNGRNLLIYNVARRYVERFVKADCRRLQKQPRVLAGTEQKVQAPLALAGSVVWIKGSIDRLDKEPEGGELRVIDYKTGTVKPEELKLKSWDRVLDDYRYAKAFQVLVYAWAYQNQQGDTAGITPGIISLKRADGLFMPVVFPDDTGQQGAFAHTEALLQQLVGELLNPDKPFLQTEDPNTCRLCDYKSLCNRF
jgi:CRISPR/Cas system-associated exonuclease Cas4 (RecB family)